MNSTVFSLRLPNDLVIRIDKSCENRNAYIKEAIEDKLNGVKIQLNNLEKRNLLKDSKTLSELLRDAMLQRLQREKDLLDNMPREDFLRLVASRLPKEEVVDVELEQSVLNLQECLAELPHIENITKELNKAKGEINKLTFERDVNLKLLKHSDNKATLNELITLVYRGAVEYIVEMVARNSLPGLGDGGGLSETGYNQLALKVKQVLQELKI